ncbi:MAG: RnfABCDGE type electron transport complex subunit D [Planctomycetota bacterium]
MRALLRLFERLRPLFDEGALLRPMRCVYDAAESFFFCPATRTERAPHIRDPLDIKRYMATVIVALVPCVAAAVYFFGLRVLAMILVSYVAGGAVEVAFAVVRRREINEGFLVTGLIFPLILPPGLPLWMVAVGVAFGVFFGKEIFGGTGRNPFNPALVGRCFLAIGYPEPMSSTWIVPGAERFGRLAQYVGASSADALSGATPLIAAKGGALAPLGDLILGCTAGSAGETCAVAIVLGGVFLIATRVANWRVVAGTLGSFLVLAALFHLANPTRFPSAHWQLFAGGLLFGAFFMATDPVTSPTASGAKWIYGALIGATTVLIRSFSGFVEGVMFAILLGNIAAPLLDECVYAIRLRRLHHEG